MLTLSKAATGCNGDSYICEYVTCHFNLCNRNCRGFFCGCLSCCITSLCVPIGQKEKAIVLNVAERGRSCCLTVNAVDIGLIDGSRCSVALVHFLILAKTPHTHTAPAHGALVNELVNICYTCDGLDSKVFSSSAE